MTFHATNYENVTVLTIKDELAGETVPAFADQAAKCLADGRHRLVLDCSGLEGLDSLGLEALLDLQNNCEEQLGAVKLCGLDATSAKILEITRLARRFETFDDLDSAVKSFG
jgi:anti-sigma B factor antagonist